MKKSIVIVTNQYKSVKSGIGTVANANIDGLSKDYEILVICPVGEEKPETKNIKVRAVQSSKYDPTSHKWFSFSKQAAKVIDELDSEKYQTILYTDARESYHTRSSIPTIGTIQDFYSAHFGKLSRDFIRKYPDWIQRYVYYKITKKLEEAAYNRLDYRVAVSQYTKDELVKYYKVKDDFHVIWNGIEFDKLKKPLKDKEKYSVLFVGGNFYRKGLPELLQAVNLLTDKYPQIKCYVIGHDKKSSTLEGVCEKAVFLGAKDYETTANYFAKCQVFCMPSEFESFSLAYLEGLYANMHVVASKNSGTPEIEKYFSNLHIVDPSNVEEIAEAIEKSFNSPLPASSKNFKVISADSMNRKYKDLIDKIADSRKLKSKTKS